MTQNSMTKNHFVVTAVAGSLICGLENVAGLTTMRIGQDMISLTLTWSSSGVLHREVSISEPLPSYSQGL